MDPLEGVERELGLETENAGLGALKRGDSGAMECLDSSHKESTLLPKFWLV